LPTSGTLARTTDIADSIADYWKEGYVVHVPLTGDIQTYINAASAGSTLILASGVYTITILLKLINNST